MEHYDEEILKAQKKSGKRRKSPPFIKNCGGGEEAVNI